MLFGRLTRVALPLLALAMAANAHASVHVGAGPVEEIDGDRSALVTLAWLTQDAHPWEFIAGYIDARNSAAIRTPGTAFVSIAKRLTWNRWFVQSGIAWADVDNDVLSNHLQFQTGAGYDFGRASVSLRHLSNANTGGRNRGETFLLLDYGF